LSSITASVAARAEDFVQSVGVNTHITYFDTTYVNTSQVIQDLAYLGIDHVRDSAMMTTDQNFLTPYKALIAAGIKFDLIFTTGLPISDYMHNVDILASISPTALYAVEGPNEIGASFTYDGPGLFNAVKMA
jgi:hypothetical protein